MLRGACESVRRRGASKLQRLEHARQCAADDDVCVAGVNDGKPPWRKPHFDTRFYPVHENLQPRELPSIFAGDIGERVQTDSRREAVNDDWDASAAATAENSPANRLPCSRTETSSADIHHSWAAGGHVSAHENTSGAEHAAWRDSAGVRGAFESCAVRPALAWTGSVAVAFIILWLVARFLSSGCRRRGPQSHLASDCGEHN